MAISMANVEYRQMSRRYMKDILCGLRKAGYSNPDARHILATYYPFVEDNAKTLIHWPVPVTMTRKEVNEAEAKILAESRDSKS